jgi:hypothetical protein
VLRDGNELAGLRHDRFLAAVMSLRRVGGGTGSRLRRSRSRSGGVVGPRGLGITHLERIEREFDLSGGASVLVQRGFDLLKPLAGTIGGWSGDKGVAFSQEQARGGDVLCANRAERRGWAVRFDANLIHRRVVTICSGRGACCGSWFSRNCGPQKNGST